MSIDLKQLPERFNQLLVSTPEGRAGILQHSGHYRFTYNPGGAPVSLTMPNRAASYNRGALHPIFEMNLPEGFVRRYIADRLQRYTRINDMLFLALQRDRSVGRLGYDSVLPTMPQPHDSLDSLLHWDGQEDIFPALLERYLFNGTLSGVQAKVLVNSGKSSLLGPDLIVKSGGDEYPQLALNETLCMGIAKAVGLSVPEFWLSDNQQLFIMKRFDRTDSVRLGMEDFAVLMGLSSQNKYRGSYEAAAKVLNVYGCSFDDTAKFFDMVVLSSLLGNGDAHLKNFALLYTHPDATPTLAPAYDIVCTQHYPDLVTRLALKLNDSHDFPDRQGLLRFAKHLHIKKAAARLEKLATLALQTIDTADLANSSALKQSLRRAIDHGMAHSAAAKYTGRSHEKAINKPRKTDRL